MLFTADLDDKGCGEIFSSLVEWEEKKTLPMGHTYLFLLACYISSDNTESRLSFYLLRKPLNTNLLPLLSHS